MLEQKQKPSRRAFISGAAMAGLMMNTESQAETPLSAWQPRASMPLKLQEIYPAVLNGKIHVAGGFISRLGTIIGATDKHIVYDPQADRWSDHAPLPEARHHPHLLGHGDKLYALGGFRVLGPGSVWAMQDQTWVLDPVTTTWSALAPAPEAHGETVSGSLDGRIHVVGGRGLRGTSNKSYGDHTDTDRHLVYDASADKWETAAPALTRRNSAAGAIIDGQFYVVAGRTVAGGNVTQLEIYDPREDKWRNGAPMPQGQGGLAAAALNGKLYAFGGEYFNNGGGVYPECWIYDPATDNWEAGPDMLTPRHGLGGLAIDGWIYAVGGAKKASGNETSNILERYQPS